MPFGRRDDFWQRGILGADPNDTTSTYLDRFESTKRGSFIFAILLVAVASAGISFLVYQCRKHESREHAVAEIERGNLPGWVEIHVKKPDGNPLANTVVQLKNGSGTLDESNDVRGIAKMNNSEGEIISLCVADQLVLNRPFAEYLCCPSSDKGAKITISLRDW